MRSRSLFARTVVTRPWVSYSSDFNWVRGDLEGLLSGGMVNALDPIVYANDTAEEPFWMEDSLWSPSAAATPTSIARILQVSADSSVC